MKITVIGATGFVGKNIVNELANRNIDVTAVSRNLPNEEINHVSNVSVDVNDTQKLSEVIKGSDIVISAFNAGWTNPNIYDDFLAGAKSIQEATKLANVKRLIVVGGAGSLFVADGVQAVDTPDFPKEIYGGASAARDYLNTLKAEKELDWAFFSPAFEMNPGTRTGNYRLGEDTPVFDENQRSILSVQDAAVVIADEAENPKHHQKRFTAAY